MYSVQPHLKQARNNRRSNPNYPNEIDCFTDEKIHHYPNSIQKSIRLHKHRIRPGLSHKSSKDTTFNEDLVKNINQQLNANINICRVFQQEIKDTPQEYSISMIPVLKQTQIFQNTTDRMYNIRKRLSPLKKHKPQYKRIACSVDSPRETYVQRASFLNIQKLELIKIYSEIQKKVDSTKGGDTLEQRYQIMPQIIQPPQIITKQMKRYVSEDNPTKDIVVSLRRTLREGHAMKWQTTTKQKFKPFQPPFQRYHYKDFIWKIAFSNGLLLSNTPEDAKLKVYVGRGNNSQLVRGFLKRRNWWTFTQKWEQANLVWTQLKINSYFNLQASSDQRYKSAKISIEKQVLARNQHNLKIMNENDTVIWDKYFRQYRILEQKLNQDMNRRNNAFKKHELGQVNLKTIRIQNHMSQNFVIGNKKALLYTMRQYYQSNNRNVFDFLPLSFHITKGIEDQQYTRFLGYFYQRKKAAKKDGTNNVWIVKPGQLTNRGNGIIVCLNLDEIKSILKRGGKHQDGTPKTFIVQQYIQKPFLYQRRKFDIRHYILVTSVNGHFKGYWFNRGYIRTSSAQYTLQNGFASVHLTNDAVQKNLPDYGRYQKGNKVSYQDFQTYLDKQYPLTYNFFQHIFPKMKQIATDVIRASSRTLDPRNLQHNFELFGLDFMIDGQFRPWLIQVNSNPCLQLSCPLLSSIIPDLVQNTMKICVDSLVGPPAYFQQKRPRFNQNIITNNQFTLVYDSVSEEIELRGVGSISSTLNLAQLDKEEDEQFQDDGQAIQD